MAEAENSRDYYLLELRIPTPSRRREKVQQDASLELSTSQLTLPKFGLVAKLEKIFELDLRTNNPYLNPTSVPRPLHAPKIRHVKFKTLEILCDSPSLPQCWNKCKKLVAKRGHLHAPFCVNAQFETWEYLGGPKWLNRGFLLEDYMETAIKALQEEKSLAEQGGSIHLFCDDVLVETATKIGTEAINITGNTELDKKEENNKAIPWKEMQKDQSRLSEISNNDFTFQMVEICTG